MTLELLPTPVSVGEEDVRQFLSEIRRYPLLTPQQERDLARRCAQGDEDAIRQLVSSNLRLVVSVARKYAGRGVPMLDLIQEGSIGLLAAARKFDYTLENKFSTYATKWIYRGVLRCLLEHGQAIRIPAGTAEQMWKVEQAKSLLLQETGEEPEPARIAAASGIPENKVEQLLLWTPELCSLDAPAGDEEGSLAWQLEDLQTPQPQEQLIRRELETTIDHLLSHLNMRQQQILRLHFGMEDGSCYSLEQISKKMDISKERVRQIEKQAMEKLHKLGENLGLEEFLGE